MEGLSIEEKAKRYDKALEKARQLCAYPTSKPFISDLQDLFPELKESDENIKKEVIEYFKHYSGGDNVSIKFPEWLGWLEKQRDIVKYYEDKLDRCVCEYFNKGYKKALEKQGEHNVKFMEKQPANQKRKLDIEKAALFATGIIEQEEWFIKGAEWSDKNPSCISSEKQGEQKTTDKILEEEKPLLEKFKQAVYDCAWGKVTCKEEGETKEEYADRWAEQFLLITRDWADDYIEFTIQQKLRNSYEKAKQKEYTFKSLPRLLEMIEPSSRAKAYCQKLIDTLIEEGYPADAKIVGECLKQMNGEDVPMAVMDENKGEQKTHYMDEVKQKAHQIAWENSKRYDPILSKESWCEIAALEMAYWLEKQHV